jgi:hypothetical protein
LYTTALHMFVGHAKLFYILDYETHHSFSAQGWLGLGFDLTS